MDESDTRIMQSNIILRCGCLIVADIADISEGAISLLVSGTQWDVPIMRVLTSPPTYMETTAFKDRPLELQQWHQYVPFDINVFQNVSSLVKKRLDPVFEEWKKFQNRPCVPQCQLASIVRGEGRFWGLWPGQHLAFKDTPAYYLQLVHSTDASTPTHDRGPEDNQPEPPPPNAA